MMQRSLFLFTLGVSILISATSYSGRYSSIAEANAAKPSATSLVFGAGYNEKEIGFRYAQEFDPKTVVLADCDEELDADVTGKPADLCKIDTYAGIPDGAFETIMMNHIGHGLPIHWHNLGVHGTIDLGAAPDLPLGDDFLFQAGHFEKYVDISSIVNQWHRILKPGGQLIWTSAVGTAELTMMDSACGFIQQNPEKSYKLYPGMSQLANLMFMFKGCASSDLGRLVKSAQDLKDVVYPAALKGLFEVVSFESETKDNKATKLVIKRVS